MTLELLDRVKAGDATRVSELLDSDPKLLGARADNGVSAILLALYYGHSKVADIFVQRGAQLDIFEAAAIGHVDRVRQLLDADSSVVNAVAPDGFQPLGLACFFIQPAAVRVLLEGGAEVDAPSRNAMQVRPIHSAAAKKRGTLSVCCWHREPIRMRDSTAVTRLCTAAAQNGDQAMIEALLTAGANAGAVPEDGKTGADLAEQAGNFELAMQLRKLAGGEREVG